MTPKFHYTRFNNAPDSTHNLLLSLIPNGARVLEFGCATGYMSAVLKERLGCTVTGIELSAEAAEAAREQCDRVIVGDAETLDYTSVLGNGQFDVILFADVLEHLRQPEAVLRRIRPFIVDRGSVVASIPNVAHGSVRLALLGGQFRYQDTGLLDRTHLRFFTRESVLDLFEQAGFVVTDWLRKRTEIRDAEVAVAPGFLADAMDERLVADPETTTYQFIVRAVRADEAGVPHPVRADLAALCADLETRDATIEQLHAQLAEQTAAAERIRTELEARDAAVHHLRQSLDERDALRADLAEIRQLAVEQASQLAALAAHVEQLAAGKDALHGSVDHLRERLLRRFDALESSLYDLRLSSTSAGSAELEEDVAYQRRIRTMREVVRALVPSDATLLVVSKGDDELLRLYGREAWHFPRMEDGTYSGEYPATSAGAIVQMEVLRYRGAQHLLFPASASWWLEHYAGFRRYLDHRYRLLHQDETCTLYSLEAPPPSSRQSTAGWNLFGQTVAECETRFGHQAAVLDWGTGLELARRFPRFTIFSPPSGEADILPYLDNSVPVVVVSPDNSKRQVEARRVAAGAVITIAAAGRNSSGGPDATAPLRLEVEWQADSASPRGVLTTSIIIPCFNSVTHTDACLRSLQETLPPGFQGEIIVVDDSSIDETPRVLEQWTRRDGRIKTLRNPSNAGFIRSCNRGAAEATGEVLVFLNNDTLTLPDWLPPLWRVFEEIPDVGAVGGKLIYPDGRLQEAGGIVFADGSAANLGRGEYNVEHPLFNFLREVDYCSGALLATRRSLFLGLGGFDERYAPAYYEDVDYCFAVRAQGYQVYYQPESLVIHCEGASSGTDLASGVKHYQVVNQAKFLDKWRCALQSQPTLYDRQWSFTEQHRLSVRRRREGAL